MSDSSHPYAGQERRSGVDRRRRGRPRLSENEDSVQVCVLFTTSRHELLCSVARRRGEDISELVRLLVDVGLAAEEALRDRL